MESIKEGIVNKIIDWIVSDSAGRLIAFKLQGNLVVQKRGDYGGKELVFRVESFIMPDEKNNMAREIPPEQLSSAPNFYLMFVVFDGIKQKIDEKFWLVPSADFKKLHKFAPLEFAKYQTNKNKFDVFLSQKLIAENRPGPRSGFKRRVF